MLGHLGSLIPVSERRSSSRQGDDGARDRIAHGLGTMTGESRSILDARCFAVARPVRGRWSSIVKRVVRSTKRADRGAIRDPE